MTQMAYRDVDGTLSVLDNRLQRRAEGTFSSDRDILEPELLELLQVVDLNICIAISTTKFHGGKSINTPHASQ